MRTFVLFACLALVGQAREARRKQKTQGAEASLDPLKTFSLALLSFKPAAAFSPSAAMSRSATRPVQKRQGQPSMQSGWALQSITPDGKLAQRVEGKTRKTWKFQDPSKDRVSVAVVSEGRPVHCDIQAWIGPDWTPFNVKAYSEDGRLRPIQTIVGTRHKETTIEIRNTGEYEFPLRAASNYAKGEMALVHETLPAAYEGERVDGRALTSISIDNSADEIEVVLKTDGRQLNARIELLNAPNNPKQTFEVFTNNGELNSLVLGFKTPDSGNTVRVVNLAPVEFPCYVHVKTVTA